MKHLIIFVVLVVISLQVYAQTKNYCLLTMCREGTHTACRNLNQFNASCPRDVLQITSGNYKVLFENAHNFYRNEIALGKIAGYEPAMRMGLMTWDNELANIALMLAKSCVNQHDLCRNTDRFKTSGQNILSVTRFGKVNVTEVVASVMDKWFQENLVMDPTYVTLFKIPDVTTLETYRNVAEMIIDKNTKLGCAMVQFTFDREFQINVVCNYASEYMVDRPLYVAGCTGAQCVRGRHATYTGLCAAAEVFEPNWY